jgi:uncharacterized protein
VDELEPITLHGFTGALSWAERPAVWSLEPDGSLAITAGPRTDLFIDPGQPDAPAPILNAPRLTSRPDGDFQLRARVSVDFRHAFDAGALVVWADDVTWAKLCFELSPFGDPMIVSVVTRGLADDCNSFEVGASAAWLRISRVGRAYAFHASMDGEAWRFVRFFGLGGRADPGVGFEAQSPTGDGCSVVFDNVEFATDRLANLRDGS